MSEEIEKYMKDNCVYSQIPANVRQSWSINEKEYYKRFIEYSIKNQLRFRKNEVPFVKKIEKQYYEDLLRYSSQSLMLFPYHLSEVIVRGLRITPFSYYIGMMESIMLQERSYDSLPNFTAADCVRLLGIGRNEYLDLMNQCRSGRKLFRRRNVKDHLPTQPARIPIDPWWKVGLGMVTEDDVKNVSNEEKTLIDLIYENKVQKAGFCDREILHSIYKKGLIYLDVPINHNDYIVVPPLEGFVMNRVLGDYFETLLYKIFVSIDEQTSVGELSTVLEIDLELVKNAVSLYCRLGFAKKKTPELDSDKLHPSWNRSPSLKRQGSVISVTDPLLLSLDELLESGTNSDTPATTDDSEPALFSSPGRSKRVAFLFDSTLTAFLMMGNLSPGLKSHAVTMFEVGKLSDESLDSLMAELEKISTDDSEGEAQRYFEHALVLRATIKFLRQGIGAPGLDLIRCESLQSLDSATCSRLLNKNYTLLVSMAPLNKEIRPISSKNPPHLGPAAPEVNTPWFKLFMYHITGSGPPTLILPQGTRLRRLPKALRPYSHVLLATWGHDPAPLPLPNLLLAANETLSHSPIVLQGLGETVKVPFPLQSGSGGWSDHPAVVALSQKLDIVHNCGVMTLVRLAGSSTSEQVLASELDSLSSLPPGPWAILDCDFGVPLFSAQINEQVCNAILNEKLWEPDNLQELVKSSDQLEKDLLRFIENVQETADGLPSSCEIKKPATLLPRRCWLFDDGQMRVWDGR